MAQRIIYHIDCNSFYASVELLRYPELRDKPVAVAGSEDARHGIILAKNEAAKKYQIRTAETVWQARKKCPQLILLPPHHREYRKYSIIINDIYARYTDRVEPFGIDESWLDMTGSWQLFGKTPFATAQRIKDEILEKTGLTVSIGISYNKIFAKMGSDYKKPNAIIQITEENYQKILWPLPVGAMLYVGEKARQSLERLGIYTIGDLAGADEALLLQVMGKMGPQLITYAKGEDHSPVCLSGEHEVPKSVGNGLTFRRNLIGFKDVHLGVGSLADEVATRLRKHHLYAGNVQVLIKDPQLKSISRQKATPYATNLAKDITQTAMELISEHWNYAKPIRMLTITAGHLTDMPFAVQTSLFEKEPPGLDPKREKLETSIDKIRERFGRDSILQAGELHNDIGVSTSARPDLPEDELE